MRALEPWHIIVLVVVIGLLFGSKRMPDAARGLGQSLRIFKSEMKQMNKDDDKTVAKKPATVEPLEGRVVDADRPAATTPSSADRHEV